MKMGNRSMSTSSKENLRRTQRRFGWPAWASALWPTIGAGFHRMIWMSCWMLSQPSFSWFAGNGRNISAWMKSHFFAERKRDRILEAKRKQSGSASPQFFGGKQNEEILWLLRACLKSGGMPDRRRFFRWARRFDAGILCVFQVKSTRPSGKRCAGMAFW